MQTVTFRFKQNDKIKEKRMRKFMHAFFDFFEQSY